ncbi:MAG TPA: ABC transporter permease [Firmicutes bacterium]|nr:ABC transporter permease [Bacillota bacterium]
MKSFLQDIYFVAWRELKHFTGQPARIIMMVVQPAIWLVLMGNMMSGLTNNPYSASLLGVNRYIDFMTPGIMIMTALFGGVYGGVSVIWDRRTGYLNKMLAAPISRSAIPVGKMIATSVQAIFQVTVIVIIALLLGVRLATGISGFLMILLMVALFSFAMAGISLALASVIKTHETLFAIINFLTMPLMFTSNAMFPTRAMPAWLASLSRWNPVSYSVEPLRALVIQGWLWDKIIQGIVFVGVFSLVMVLIATRQFNKSIA